MPLFDYNAARKKRLAESQADPIELKLNDGPPFRCKPMISAMTMIEAMKGMQDQDSVDLVLKEIFIEEDFQRLHDNMRSDDPALAIDIQAFRDFMPELIRHFTGGAPMGKSESSSATPSPFGQNSTAASPPQGIEMG